MTQENYDIGVLQDLKSAIRTAWGSGAEIEKTEICNALNAAIKALEQETKTGYWIHGEYCSECGCDVPAYIIDWKWQKDMNAKYCPNCGAYMRGKEE